MQVTKKLAKQVISYCEYFRVENVIISPGSRNAPLTIGFSTNTNFKCFSIVDERCAAFFALGMAQQTQKPVVLVCTSGSALLNYYPAVTEAFYSNIPLVVISADRPKHLIDIGDGQTIRQKNVYKNHIGFSANLIEKDNKVSYNAKLIQKAFKIAIETKSPVHINTPFDEPLYDCIEEHKCNVIPNYPIEPKPRKNLIHFFRNKLIKLKVNQLINTYSKSKKTLLLVGVNYPSEELQKILNTIINRDNSVIVMTETTSNLSNPKFINSIDQLITNFDDNLFKELQPDLLITFGSFIVSKRIKNFLRKYQPKNHYHIDPKTKLNTYFCLTHFIQKEAVGIFNTLRRKTSQINDSDYQNRFLAIKEQIQKKHSIFLDKAEYSDLKAVSIVLNSIPNETQFQVSNSSMIRYVQLFNFKKSIDTFCNRGTSGIDGSTSTAIGASYSNNKQTILITGDISFFYDSNALWNKYIPNNFRIILMNNDGGSIFKIIPGPSKSKALEYFETKHGLTAEKLAEMYNFEYLKAINSEEIKNKLDNFYKKSDSPKILEIFTPSAFNDIILKKYFNSLKTSTI